MKDSPADTNPTARIADARSYALRLLGYRSRSRKEMRERLRGKKFSDNQINTTIKFLKAAGLMNDKAVALELLRYATERKNLGRKGLEMFLSRRGIERDLISEILTNHTAEMEKETASKLVERKLMTLRRHPKNVIRRRLWGMLQRRGISADIAHRVIKDIEKK